MEVSCHLHLFIVLISFDNFAHVHTIASTDGMEQLWTAWAHWSPCSLTCGQGVRSRNRDCVGVNGRQLVRLDNPDCNGKNKEYTVCESEDCPTDSPDLREMQCTKHNMETILDSGDRHEWIPFYGGSNPCELTCMARGYNFYNGFGNVIDGTPCHRKGDSKDVCVSGRCERVDCDGAVGSNKVEDWCKICGGNNVNCTVIRKSYNVKSPKAGNYDYQLIVKIPAGATYLEVTDTSKNYLALADKKERYLINGHWMIDWPGQYDFAGTSIMYKRDGDRETMKADGPIKEDLYLMLIFRVYNPGVFYKFFLPSNKFNDIVYPKENRHSKIPKQIIFGPEKPTIKLSVSESKSSEIFNEIKEDVYSDVDKSSEGTMDKDKNLREKYTSNKKNKENAIIPDKFDNDHKYGHTDDRVHLFGYDYVALNENWVNNNKRSDTIQTNYRKDVDKSTDADDSGTIGKVEWDNPSYNTYASLKEYSQGDQMKNHKKNTQNRHQGSSQENGSHNTGKQFSHSASSEVNCHSCHTHRPRMDYLCKSDFALRGRIQRVDSIDGDTRFEVQVIHAYKELFPLLKDEYIWLTGNCYCPEMEEDQEYIIMGRLLPHLKTRESRLQLEANGYVRQYSRRAAVRLDVIGKRCPK